jgi:hypothetical protein
MLTRVVVCNFLPGVAAGSGTESEDGDVNGAARSDLWVCEPCCTGVKKPVCALCPNDGGAFKQCELDGSWVHAICSL